MITFKASFKALSVKFLLMHRTNFLRARPYFSKKIAFNIRCKNEIEDNNERYAVNSAKNCPRKSI